MSVFGKPNPETDCGPLGGEQTVYRRAIGALADGGVPVLTGGALALAAYAGIRRTTKDLDLFVLERDVPRVLGVLQRAGFRTDTPFPHWLAKAYSGDQFIDIIFSSGNGAARVDEGWFKHAVPARAFGLRILLCPPEETIWSKAFSQIWFMFVPIVLTVVTNICAAEPVILANSTSSAFRWNSWKALWNWFSMPCSVPSLCTNSSR